MAEAFPLQWPDGWPRTNKRSRARYQVEFGRALHELRAELRLMEATSIVVSSNVMLRRDGFPYADMGSRKMDDPGVAVYFFWKNEPWVIAADAWDLVKDNVRAVGLTVSSLRQIERSGASELMKRAFSGFKALPAPGGSSAPTYATSQAVEVQWYHILEVSETASREIIDAAYRAKAKGLHPDTAGAGSHDAMARLNNARAEAVRAVALRARSNGAVVR